jgi:hypothetical protein
MSDDVKVSNSIQVGPGAAVSLTILFVILKVMGKIDWSWWWVFAPLWLTPAIVLGCVALFFIGALIVAATEK